MILSKSLLHTRNSFLTILKNHKVQSLSIHHLQSISILKLRPYNAVIAPEICNIIYRYQSSQTPKDTILHLHKEENIAVTSNVSDGLPAIPVPAEDLIASAVQDDTTIATSELPEIIADAVVELNKLGEPTLQSLGLGNPYTPTGLVQLTLEFVHVNCNLPWWASIAICVVFVRICMFPLVIYIQRNSAKMSQVMPEMQEIQLRMQNAKTYGNHVEMMKAGHELQIFMKEKNVMPGRTILFPLLQAPVFLSFFLGLRQMAYAPVQSMSTGGMLWFSDLTVMDEYYLLPLITCTSLWTTLKVGADFSQLPSASLTSRHMSTVLTVIPVILFPFIMHFPSAICVYWATTNIVSLVQVGFLKIPSVREYFNISKRVKHDPSKLPIKKKGIIKDMKGAYANMRIAKEIAERERLDEANFKRAGRVPPAKTFKYDPTVTKTAVQAKKA